MTFILSVILGTRIYPLLMLTLLFKERYIVHHCYQTKRVTTGSKLREMKGNFHSNWPKLFGNIRQHYQNPPIGTRGISGAHITHDLRIKGTGNLVCRPNRLIKTQDSRHKTYISRRHYVITPMI